MRRFLATLMIAAIGTTVVGAGIALAAEIEVTPADPTEGPAELTIDVWDFDPNTPIFASSISSALPGKASAPMNRLIVKPMPQSMATP